MALTFLKTVAKAQMEGTKPSNAIQPKTVVEDKKINAHPLMKEREAAEILCVSLSYLQQDRWRSKNEGTPPSVPFIKMQSGHVRYHIEDIQAVIDSQRVG